MGRTKQQGCDMEREESDSMQADWKDQLTALVASVRVCFLATAGSEGPEASMAPFALYRGDVLIHLSRLAQHSRNLQRQHHLGLIICTPETAADSPLALPRVSLKGEAEMLIGQQALPARAAYLSRIPEAGPLFSFPDFRLFRMRVAQARWVGGFGKARTLSSQTWNGLFAAED